MSVKPTTSVRVNSKYLIRTLQYIITKISDTLGQDFMINDYDHWNRPINTSFLIDKQISNLLKLLKSARVYSKSNYTIKQLRQIINQFDTNSNSKNKQKLEKLLKNIQLGSNSRKIIKQLRYMLEQAKSVEDEANQENMYNWNDPTKTLDMIRIKSKKLINYLNKK